MTPKIHRSYRRLDRSLVQAIKRVHRPTAEPVPGERIVAAVCAKTGFTFAQLQGPGRGRDVTYARHLAMYGLKTWGRWTIVNICGVFRRDHSTVIAGINRITLELSTRRETAVDVEVLKSEAA